jgi:hypothetical protein
MADWNMQSVNNHRFDGRRWRSVVIAVAICSLTLSVATRFWTVRNDQSHVVKSIDRPSVEPKRQHLNKDATRWVASSADLSVIEPTAIEISSAPNDPLLPKHVFGDSLYNRPPPSSKLLL